jgi:hypothetical protein
MADNNDLLHQIRNIVREENESIKERLDGLEQGQAQTNNIIAQIKTVVETLEAGQNDIREQKPVF